jgi:hypothetical protein
LPLQRNDWATAGMAHAEARDAMQRQVRMFMVGFPLQFMAVSIPASRTQLRKVNFSGALKPHLGMHGIGEFW